MPLGPWGAPCIPCTAQSAEWSLGMTTEVSPVPPGPKPHHPQQPRTAPWEGAVLPISQAGTLRPQRLPPPQVIGHPHTNQGHGQTGGRVGVAGRQAEGQALGGSLLEALSWSHDQGPQCSWSTHCQLLAAAAAVGTGVWGSSSIHGPGPPGRVSARLRSDRPVGPSGKTGPADSSGKSCTQQGRAGGCPSHLPTQGYQSCLFRCWCPFQAT